MSKKKRDKRAEWNFDCAIIAFDEGAYFSYSTLEQGGKDGEDSEVIPSPYPSPEGRLIKLDLYRGLGNEAKEVLTLIYQSPKGISTPRTGTITRASVKKFLRKIIGWDKRKVESTFDEVSRFIREAL